MSHNDYDEVYEDKLNVPYATSVPPPPNYNPWYTQPPSIFIVNPMHIVTLSDRTKSQLVRFVEAFKSFTEKWFSHILLLLVLFLYACLGAWIFMVLEGNYEAENKAPIVNHVLKIKNELYLQSYVYKLPKQHFMNLVELRLREFEKQVQEKQAANVNTDSGTTLWTFTNSLFYCATIFTTIGYGTLFPVTTWGKVATIIYSVIGIPLMLMVLTDLGKLFTRAIKMFFKLVRRIYKAKKIKKMRQAGRRATAVPTQFMTVAWGNMQKRLSNAQKPGEIKPTLDVENGHNLNTGYVSPSPMVSAKSPGNMYPTTPKPVIVATSPTPPMTAYVESRPVTPVLTPAVQPYEVDDEFNLPVSAALLILLLYMMLGSIIFCISDKWDPLDSFYFVWISMSTIGFGDLTPEKPIWMIASSVYFLFGLALTSMCINVVQEKLSESFQRAKIRLAGNMGLDVQTMMAQEDPSQVPKTDDRRSSEKDIKKKDPKDKKSPSKELKDNTEKDKRKKSTSFEDTKPTKVDNSSLQPNFTLKDDFGRKLKERREKKPKSEEGKLSSDDEPKLNNNEKSQDDNVSLL